MSGNIAVKMRYIRTCLVRMRVASWHELLYRVREKIFIWRLGQIFYSGKKNLLKIPRINLLSLQSLSFPEIRWNKKEDTPLRFLKGDGYSLHVDLKAVREFERIYQNTFFADIPLSGSGPDIRMIWEPSRLQHIMILLLACRNNLGKAIGKKFCDEARKTLFDWLAKNPFLAGPHYISVMECGLRIPVFFLQLKS